MKDSLSRIHVKRYLRITIFFLACGVEIAGGEDLAFQRHVINADTDYSAAAVLDVNRDGRPDIVCGGDWYEAPDWKRHFVRNVERIRGRPDGFAHLAFDVNRDGWLDVITVNYRSSSIKWIEHPGPEPGPWTTHLAVEPGPMETGRLVDVDGDGKFDLLPNGARFAAWYELSWQDSGVGAPDWVRHELPPEAGGHGLGFGDVDGDGRKDLVAQFGWLKAPEDPRNGRWYWNPEYHLERASIPMIVADVDQDGDGDIVWCSAHGFGVYWLEQIMTADRGRSWTRHAIDTGWSQGHGPLWVDLDGDGRNEFVAGKRYMSHGGADPGAYDPLVVYRYQFDPHTRAWQRWTISAGQRVGAGLDPKAADMDGDGDLDLVLSGRSGLYLLENLGPAGSDRERITAELPEYVEGAGLLTFRTAAGTLQPVKSAEEWGQRRAHIVASIEKRLGGLPGSHDRVPLEMTIEGEGNGVRTKRVTYRLTANRSASADLILPEHAPIGRTPAMLCLFDDPDGADARQVVAELKRRGYASLVPDWSHPPDLAGSVWRAVRSVDLLQSLLEVHGERIGLWSEIRAGALPFVVSALDQRIIATVVRGKDSGGTGPGRSPVETRELIAAIAPRSVWISAQSHSSGNVAAAAADASPVFELGNSGESLHLERPAAEPSDDEQQTMQAQMYDWLDQRLRPRGRRPRR